MEHGTGWLKLDTLGSNVRIRGLTPAEAVILRKQFGVQVEGQARPLNPFTHLKVADTDYPLNDSAEYDRLVKKYGAKNVSDAFPGEVANLPKSFDVLLEKDPDGKVMRLPEEPASGGAQLIVPLRDIPRDDGSDLEPATKAKQATQDTAIVELQAKVELLTRLLGNQNQQAATAAPVVAPTTEAKVTMSATTDIDDI